MIKANEIRHNNLFIIDGKVQAWSIYWGDQLGDGVIKLEEIDPIPLTPEIMEKAGYKKDIENTGPPINEDLEVWHHEWAPVSFMIDNYGALIICDYHVNINRPKFVHQLQNLIFALTGEELQISL